MWKVYILVLASVATQTLGCSWWIMGCICKKYTNYSIRTSCTSVKFEETNFEYFTNASIVGTNNFYNYLHTLNLTDTHIENIEEGAFLKYKSLKNLFMSKNKLRQLDSHMIGNISSLRYLDLSYNELTSLNDTLQDTLITNLNLEYNEFTEVLGNTFPMSLTYLNMANNKIADIKELNLTHLNKLNLSYNELEIIKVDVLNLPAIRYLDLSHNFLKDISHNAFAEFQEVSELNLGYNKLTKLDGFLGLKQLNILNLTNNVINNVEKDAFKNMTNLLILDLSRNKLTTVHPDAFGELTALNKLDLSHNEIFEIETNNFEKISSLIYLNLNNNKLNKLKNGSFKHNSIEYLNLSNNQIVEITAEAFAEMPELVSLNLNGNRLTTLDRNVLDNLPNLKNLNLSSNNINTIKPFAFSNLKNLNTIDLSRNRLRILENNIFNHLDNLFNLNISYNELSEVSDDLEGVKSIKNLDISFNLLRTVSHFKHFTNLSVLNMSHNVIDVLEKNTFDDTLVNLTELILRGNLIKDIPTACFGHLQQLRNMDLSHNQLTKLDASNTVGLRLLRSLLLSSNLISNVSSQAFHNMPNLYILDVSNNKLTTLNYSELIEIRYIDINNNLFYCNELSTFLNNLRRRTSLIAGTEKDRLSMRGIYCLEDPEGEYKHEASKLEHSKGLESLESSLSTISTLLVIIILIVLVQICAKLVMKYKWYFSKPQHYQSQRSDLESML